MAASVVTAPRCYVDIYPHEGGQYAITNGQVLQCTVRKFMKEPAGQFSITLAPGGPLGTNVGPSWLDVITPMSFVKIGMARGNNRNIVMLGVATKINEVTDRFKQPNERYVKILGMDFGYFFTHFSWYALAFANVNASALGAALGTSATAGAALGTAPGTAGYLTKGTPDAIGAAWYTGVMDGDQGILSKTWVQNGKNNQVLFDQMVTVDFEKYPDNVTVPWSFTYVSAEESWYDKFNKIFPYPFYEFFVMTAPAGFYAHALTTNWNNANVGGTTITMMELPGSVAAQIYVIARVNPLPALKAMSNGNNLTFNGLDTTAWNGLTMFTDSNEGFLKTEEEFCEEEVRNFFLINPTYYSNQYGQANDQNIPAILGVAAAVDTASIHRYGFRPAYMETDWFSDPTGQVAQSSAVSGGASGSTTWQDAMADLTARLAAQYEPVSMMMRASRISPLRPDIIPGNQFSYQPLKDKVTTPWSFYIEGLEHNFVFGGPSFTTLTLSRGLPQPVYAQSGSNGLLNDIFMGNAERINGQYMSGLPTGPGGAEKGLQGVPKIPDQLQQLLAEIAPLYSTAKGADYTGPGP